MSVESQIKVDLVKKLLSRRVIGNNHIRMETILKCGWKPHEKGFVKKEIKNLLKEGTLVWAKKSKKALTLNKERIKQIKSQYAKED